MATKVRHLQMTVLLISVLTDASSKILSTKLGNNKYEVLSEVLIGAVKRRTVMLHLHDSLPFDTQRTIMTLQAVQETPHFTFSLGNNRISLSQWQASSYTSSLLHLVIFLTPPTNLEGSLWLTWKPQNILLFNMGPDHAVNILKNDLFERVKNLVLITRLKEELQLSYGVYSLQPFGSRHPKFLGMWDNHSFSRWEMLFQDRFPSFQGYTFQLATWMTDLPYLYKSSEGNLRGVSLNILAALASAMNFTYTLTEKPHDLKWGLIENGSWVGVLGMVYRGEKNFSIHPFYLSFDRMQAFDASYNLESEGVGLFLLKPQPLPTWPNIYRSFTFRVWAFVAATFLAALLIIRFQVSA